MSNYSNIHSHKNTLDSTTYNEQDKFGNPNNYAGIWFTLHLMATNATTPEKISLFIENLKLVVENLKCLNCREHAMKYLMEHPIAPYFTLKDTTGRLIGMAKYVWEFHNAVNSRLGKPIIDWHTAYQMYSNNNFSVCHHDCGQSTVQPVQPITYVSILGPYSEKEVPKYPISKLISPKTSSNPYKYHKVSAKNV
jgi:hypothetical protein